MIWSAHRVGTTQLCQLTAAAALLFTAIEPALAQQPIANAADTASPPQASAGGAHASSGRLEEIVVTAQKRTENQQHAPLAVTTLSSKALANAGVTQLTKITAAVPGIGIDTSLGQPVIYLRGVGPQVAFPNYGVAVPFLQDGVDVQMETLAAGLFDVAQAEVLRGPQGTLYGRDAIGGVVNVTTQKPVLTGAHASVELEGGSYGEFRGFGMFNLPITDTLAVRGSFQHEQHDGYLTNNSGYVDNDAGRLELRYKPDDHFDATVTTSFSRQASNTQNWVLRECGVSLPATLKESPQCGSTPHQYGLINSNNPWYDPQKSSDHPLDENGWSVSTNMNYRFDSGPVLSFLGQYARSALSEISLVGPNTVATQQRDKSVSEELRLSDDIGKGQGEIKWLVGVYHFESDTPYSGQVSPATSQPAYFPVVPQGTQFFPPIPGAYVKIQESTIEQTSYASFGQLTYSILDHLRATGGLRYSWDRERGQSGDAPVGPIFPPFQEVSHDEQSHEINFKVGLDMDLTQTSLLYMNVQTGYLQGGFDLSSNPSFKPETMTEYSFGSKNRFLSNKLELNGEIFYYDYKDYQLSYSNPNSGAQEIFSAPKAVIYGADTSAQYLLTDDDRLSATFSYLHAKIADFTTPFATTWDVANSLVELPAGTSLKGYDLIEAPKLAGSVGYQHDFGFRSGARLIARVDNHFESGHWGVFQHPAASYSPSFSKTDVNLTYYSSDARWHINGYIYNIENAVSFGAGLGLAGAFIMPPRTYGMKIGYDF